MAIKTDLNVNPYFDDFNEEKLFHRILFKPGVAVQARELTQLQTILQNQIERFGDFVFKDGSIVVGCNFQYENNLNFVKLRDQNKIGEDVILVQIAGLIARRIVTETSKDNNLDQGERVGMIRFGSRADLYFENYQPIVKVNQKTIAGETILARK